MCEVGASGFLRGLNAVRLDLLDLLGADYAMQTCIGEIDAQRKEEAYRVYETDCLYAIGRFLKIPLERRFYDILHPTPKDTRTGEEIANDRLAKFGIKVVS